MEIVSHHIHSVPIPPGKRSAALLSAEFEQVLLRCLAKSPADRYQDALELSEALRRCPESGVWTNVDASQWWLDHDSHQGVVPPAMNGPLPYLETVEVDRARFFVRRRAG